MCCKLQNEHSWFYSEGPIDRCFRAADKTPKSGNSLICNTSVTERHGAIRSECLDHVIVFQQGGRHTRLLGSCLNQLQRSDDRRGDINGEEFDNDVQTLDDQSLSSGRPLSGRRGVAFRQGQRYETGRTFIAGSYVRCRSGFEPVRDAFPSNFERGREIGAAVAVCRRGMRVVDLAAGVQDPKPGEPYSGETLQLIFSVTASRHSALRNV
jgi:hypothetical protein